MFRITTINTGDEFVLKVEGCLAGACVPELERCWRQAASTLNGRSMLIDLGDVCHVDEGGRTLMTEMCRAHVRFLARGCVMPEIVREVTEAANVSSLIPHVEAGGIEPC